MLAESMQEEYSGQSHPMGEQEIFSRLKQRGVVDNILQQIQFDGQSTRPATHMRGEQMFDKVADKRSKKIVAQITSFMDNQFSF